MDSNLRQIAKHSAIFGLGQLVTRLASILLLPVYTRYLSPLDYGVMALLDITTALLGIVIGAGVPTAASRAHFDQESEGHRDRVWWTALAMAAALATLVVVPVAALRGGVARLALGAQVVNGPRLLALSLWMLWVGTLDVTLDQYLRVLKASKVVVGISIARLLLNIVLNVTLLAVWDMGLEGVLWGNLAAGCAALAARSFLFLRSRGRPAFDSALALGFWRFGWPLILTGLLSVMMHEADRYLLRAFADLDQVGLYSLAYQIGQGASALVLMPFGSIWSVMVFEIARQPDAKATYATVFKYFVFGVSATLFLAALFAGPVLSLIAPPAFAPAAELVPVICLAYFFFSLHNQFSAPALVAQRTVALLPVYALSAAVNVALNLALIPTLGAFGAAWASVATFVVFAGAGLLRYRRIDRYPYRFGLCALVLVGMALTYLAVKAIVSQASSVWLASAVAAVAWTAWAVPLLGGAARRLLKELRPRRRVS